MKRLAVIGLGAIGSLVGGYLARGGEDVTLISAFQRDQAAHLSRTGLRITGNGDDFHVPVRAVYLEDLAPEEQFDLVFLDPPYGDALLASCLAAVEPHIADGGLVVCESDEGQALPETVGALQADRTYRYGRVHITLYRRKV